MKDFIVLHHSLTQDGATVSWPAIRRYHVGVNGWRDIGYHYGIEEIDGHYEILVGRPENEEGAHCKDAGMNQAGLGICLVGNFDGEVPTLELLGVARRLVRSLMAVHGIPVERVIGHGEAQALAGIPEEGRKSCPGRLFDMEKFRRELGQTI